MSELILENEYLKVTFPGTKAGLSGIWLKGYNAGSAIPTEWNRLSTPEKYPRVMSGDYHGIYVLDNEYWSGDFNWFTYKTTMSSRDLYGNQDPNPAPVQVDVIKVVSGDTLNIGSDRAISGQELTYYFTPDGQGLIKRVRLNIKKLGSQASNLQSVLFMDYVAFSPVSYNTGCQYYRFKERSLGFDYNTLAEFQADWTADAGLTCSVGRNSLYPNLLPGFSDAGWIVEAGAPSVVDDGHLDLTTGDVIYIDQHNAYPANRTHTLTLSVQNMSSGTLRVKYGLSRKAIDSETEAQTLDITDNGTYTLQDISSCGDNYLFLKLEQLSGACQVYAAAVKYLKEGVGYNAYDGAYLANTSLRNCIRVQSANPDGLRLIYNFASNVKIGSGKGIKLMALSLDNTSIEDGAFRIIFQKPDDTWVESGDINMFVDYNDLYPQGAWERSNLWADSFFGVQIPDGVDEIKAIGIKWITTEPIDWLLDGFGVMVWQDDNVGIGARPANNLGLPAGTLRMRDMVLRGVQGIYHSPPDGSVNGEAISVVVVGGTEPYGEYVPLTFQNNPSISNVYQIDNTKTLDTNWSSWIDRGYELEYDAGGISNYLYPVKVQNITQGEQYTITRAIGDKIVVDISQSDYSTGDTLRITYAKKVNVDSAHYSLAQNRQGEWCVKWAYDSWSIANNRERVYVDYTVSSRGDDTISCIVGGTNHDVNRLVQDYFDQTDSPPLCATYSTLVFSDPSNEIAETLFVYQPVLNKTGEALYSEAQAVQDVADKLYANSRTEPLSPTPRNYNLVPHIAFGGEFIAANPIEYLQQVNEKFFQANCSNAIVSGGSLSYLRDRDMDTWWWWGGSLRDNGVDYLTATRNILRRGYPESRVSQDLNQHRYFLELTTFAYEHTKRYNQQASIDYKGNSGFKRVWYYEADSGLYTAVTRVWDDFDAAYYDPVVINGENYYFQYHYVLIIPAFWSVVTPAANWGLNVPTIYDLMKRRIEYVCQSYDCEGPIISEFIYYAHSFTNNDFSLYNDWRVNVKGWSAASDWPRDVDGNVEVDNLQIWEWKSYYVKQYLTDMAAVAHAHNKLLGVNVNVQNIIPVRQPQAGVWEAYEKKQGDYGTCVNTLDYSTDRYGTPFADLLKENICDVFYVWLYYRYSAFGMQTVYDFIQQFAQYKERMLLTVGLFPKDNPPPKEEVVSLVQDLLRRGFNVAYAGYPPMMIQDERWADVWQNFFDYVPSVYVNGDSQLEVNPKKVQEVPFWVRF
jgi:hypothetical protein